MASVLATILLWLSRATGVGYLRRRNGLALRGELDRREAVLDEAIEKIQRDIHRPLR